MTVWPSATRRARYIVDDDLVVLDEQYLDRRLLGPA